MPTLTSTKRKGSIKIRLSQKMSKSGDSVSIGQKSGSLILATNTRNDNERKIMLKLWFIAETKGKILLNYCSKPKLDIGILIKRNF